MLESVTWEKRGGSVDSSSAWPLLHRGFLAAVEFVEIAKPLKLVFSGLGFF